jgi:hypothetical protein
MGSVMRIFVRPRAILGAVLAAALLLPVVAAPSISAEDACPEPPLSVGDLLDLYLRGGPLRERYPMAVTQINEQGLACYGSQTLAMRVFVAPPGGVGGTQSYRIEPGWLSDHRLFVYGTSGRIAGTDYIDGPYLTVAVPPEFGDVWDRFDRSWVHLAGRFDHPAAQSCVASGIEGETPSPAEAIEICRSFFVLTGIEALPSAPATDAAPEPGPTAAPGGPAAILLAGVAAWFAAMVASSGSRDRSRHAGSRSTRLSDQGRR